MPKQPHAPPVDIRLCRICSRPEYLQNLCYKHYRILEVARRQGVTLPPDYAEWQQDADRIKHETKDCGCPWYPQDYHAWDCALNASAEVGQEHIFEADV